MYSVAAAILVLSPTLASAYVGPGAGLSAVGSLFALLMAVAVSFLGFFWYPIKRLLSGRKSAIIEDNDSQARDHRS